MLLNVLQRRALQRLILTMMALMLGITHVLSAWAQQSSSPGSPPNGLVWKVCDPPPVCFASKQARQEWAKQNNCQFLEDVCESTPPDRDNKGAKAEDQGFWGSLWDDIKGALVYGYEFVKGLLTGLKEQVSDLFSLITNLDEVVGGLVELGKAFYNDPNGTLVMLGELLGQEAIDTFTRATQCGAYDLGKIIGETVSPVVMLKLATRLKQYGGKLADAVKATKHDFGCASFAAGTPVLTSQGPVPIERIAVGQQVWSRHARSFADQPQLVTVTFGRIAPSYRLLQTEFDTFRLTDEHPLWVQGKGWTEAKDITDEDVIASWNGDALVIRNEAVNQPLRVYNFSVDNTPNYFVGEGGVWAHNAKCEIVPGGLAAHEAAGGHLLARHVGQSDTQLLNRLASDPHISAASSFIDRATAEYAVSAALDANRTAIQGFLNGSSNRLVINHSLSSPVGISVSRGATSAVPASNVRVVLQRDASMPTGYRIVTGFPTP